MAVGRAPVLSKPLLWAIAMLLAAAPCHCGLAQQSAGAGLGELSQSPVEVLKGFEPAADQEYELGSGDEITVEILGRSELSGKHTIGPDGRITLPVAGDVKVAGRTRSQADQDILAILHAYYQDISVSVSVDRYSSNRILLLGAVEHPGLMLFDNTPTLLEVISRGGLAAQTASTDAGSSSASRALPSPISMPELCMIYRGGQTVVAVQLRNLLRSGDPLANMRLKRNDVVFVPGEYAYVSVLGSVLRPGLMRLEPNSTLAQFLAASGGLSEKSGHYPQILVIHPGTANARGSIETVSFRDILASKPLDLAFHSGDVIYVAESGFNHVADVLQKISPLINLITVGALLGQ